MHIRHFGFLANRCRETTLAQIRRALKVPVVSEEEDNGKIFHQIIDDLPGIIFGAGSQVRVFAGGHNTGMTENILHILQADT